MLNHIHCLLLNSVFDTQVLCKSVAALLQYFLLSAFCWMLCEGIMLYLMLVVVFSTLSKKWWLFCIIGWGEVVYVLLYDWNWYNANCTKLHVVYFFAGELRYLEIGYGWELKYASEHNLFCPWCSCVDCYFVMHPIRYSLCICGYWTGSCS